MQTSLKLNDAALLRNQAWVGGEWRDTAGTFPVTDPATGDTIANVADCTAADTAAAVRSAFDAQRPWASRPAAERAVLIRNLADAMLANEDDLARIIGYENGKPITEAIGEVRYAAGFLRWFAEEARRVDGSMIPSPWTGTSVVAVREAIGVAAVITPWNFPAAMLTRKIGPAFAVGCTIVAKPAEQTPLTALALAELSDRVGFPPGVFNVVTGSAESAPSIGTEMTSNRLVRKLSFTGSTAVGKLLAAQSAQTVKRVSLELGGNAPLIVFDDADIDTAIAGTLVAKFRNSGQTCVAANRIFVHEAIEDRYVERLSESVAALKVGPFDAGSDIGPLIDTTAVAKVEQHIANAVASGARIIAGGAATDLGPQFFAPTILLGTTPDMTCHQDETFGPVVSLARFTSTDEVVALANDTDSGLAAYIFTRDHARVWDVSRRLEYGMVGVNTGVISAPEVPFGGIKQSGIGREGSRYGTDDWTEIKYIAMAGIGPTP